MEASEWISPLVVARRANGKICLCCLRSLNDDDIVDQYPLPRVDEMLSLTRGAKYFSTIDLSSAYHQISLHHSSRNLTAFCTPFGCFHFRRMPFGLASAAVFFQRLIAQLFGDMPGITFFQDDILIMGNNSHQHDSRLRKVLTVLNDKGLTAEILKCKFSEKKRCLFRT